MPRSVSQHRFVLARNCQATASEAFRHPLAAAGVHVETLATVLCDGDGGPWRLWLAVLPHAQAVLDWWYVAVRFGEGPEIWGYASSASDLRGDDLPLTTGHQPLRLGQAQIETGDVAEITGPADFHDICARPLALSLCLYQPQYPSRASVLGQTTNATYPTNIETCSLAAVPGMTARLAA